jgi:hypothetical protein
MIWMHSLCYLCIVYVVWAVCIIGLELLSEHINQLDLLIFIFAVDVTSHNCKNSPVAIQLHLGISAAFAQRCCIENEKFLHSAVVRASPISISCVWVLSLNKITKSGATNNMYTACIKLLRVQHNDVMPGKTCSASISDMPKKIVSPNASFSATSSFWFRQIQGSEYKLENVCQNWVVFVALSS